MTLFKLTLHSAYGDHQLQDKYFSLDMYVTINNKKIQDQGRLNGSNYQDVKA